MKEIELYHIRQKFDASHLSDVSAAVAAELSRLQISDKLQGGKRIAITCGSRGINHIAEIIRAVSDFVKDNGGAPFVVPAMGSHGGATAEGQLDMLAEMGVRKETVGCEIVSSMETVVLGYTQNGSPVHMDKNAFNSDGIIVVNRVKPHMAFISDTESGIVKMVAVGLGKQRGATAMHHYGLTETIQPAFNVAKDNAPIIAGLAIEENAIDETALVEAVLPCNFVVREATLLELAKQLMPSIPCKEADVLVVKEIGKLYSGTGMDTKVIGRMRIAGLPEPEYPNFKKVVALRLAESAHGNALGSL